MLSKSTPLNIYISRYYQFTRKACPMQTCVWEHVKLLWATTLIHVIDTHQGNCQESKLINQLPVVLLSSNIMQFVMLMAKKIYKTPIVSFTYILVVDQHAIADLLRLNTLENSLAHAWQSCNFIKKGFLSSCSSVTCKGCPHQLCSILQPPNHCNKMQIIQRWIPIQFSAFYFFPPTLVIPYLPLL